MERLSIGCFGLRNSMEVAIVCWQVVRVLGRASIVVAASILWSWEMSQRRDRLLTANRKIFGRRDRILGLFRKVCKDQ